MASPGAFINSTSADETSIQALSPWSKTAAAGTDSWATAERTKTRTTTNAQTTTLIKRPTRIAHSLGRSPRLQEAAPPKGLQPTNSEEHAAKDGREPGLHALQVPQSNWEFAPSKAAALDVYSAIAGGETSNNWQVTHRCRQVVSSSSIPSASRRWRVNASTSPGIKILPSLVAGRASLTKSMNRRTSA